ncbi:MAG: septum formation inhibitor Maf [Deltaproteobacteria bacterium]|nr:septum formation inhibitor Maf [Deltaproteobacteria bacterium]
MESEPRRFILASGSPRRRAMFAEMGVAFEVVVSNVPEDEMHGETPDAHVRRLAYAKADEVARGRDDALVLGVDTIVVIDGEILGKPANEGDAERMLGRLAGRDHTVFTGYALVWTAGVARESRVVQSRVFMRALTPERIQWYVATGEPMDKAGAYAIQGIGASLVTRVEGSYTCVVGLPLAEAVLDIERLVGPEWLFGRRP